jgi:hypothetical protein
LLGGCTFVEVFVFGGVGHAHLFSIPHLAAPTNTIGVDDASACSTASGVFGHDMSF